MVHNNDTESQQNSTIFPSRKGKWSQKFLVVKDNLIKQQEASRKLIDDERRRYRPRSVDFGSVSNFVDQEISVVPVPYDESGTASRNNACIYCDEEISRDEVQLGCAFCPAIIHKKCICDFNNAQRNDSLNISSPDELSTAGTSDQWCCPDCKFEVEESRKHERDRLKADRRRRLEFICSRKLQASLMRNKEQHRFNVLKNGMLRLQARARGVARRTQFMFELTTNHRSFRIKACDYSLPGVDIDSKSNICCTICIVNDESEDLDDCEKQMYRFDTQGLSQHNSNGRWNDSFMVYSCNCLVLFAFTLHSDRLFLGQSVFDASSHLKKAFFSGNSYRYKAPLGPLEIDPREQGSKLPFRFDKGDNESSAPMGKITFEVQPVSNVHSKCGVLEEILSALLKGATKKWYAVLADKTLFLFSQFGDSRPKATIPLQAGTKIEWHDRTVIKISSFDRLDQSWFFTCPNSVQRTSWYNKLTGELSKILDDGAKQYRIIEQEALRAEKES